MIRRSTVGALSIGWAVLLTNVNTTVAAAEFESSFDASPTQIVTLSYESVGDSVNYAPNLSEGGFATARNKQRYSLRTLSFSTPAGQKRLLQATLAEHNLTSLRDSIKVTQIGFGLRQQLRRWTRHKTLDIELSINHSFSQQFHKNSYTHTDKGLVTSADIDEPNDLDAAFKLHYRSAISGGINLVTSSTLGFQKTQYKRITGTGKSDQGCSMAFTLEEVGGSLTQTKPCGQVLAYKQTFPDDLSLQNRLGIQPKTEMQYHAMYLEQGISIVKTLSKSTLMYASYTARLYRRSQIDNRSFGYQHTPVKSNQVVSIGAQRHISPRFSVNAAAYYRIAPFLDKVPFLYTRYTAHRYSGSAASFSIAAQYRFH